MDITTDNDNVTEHPADTQSTWAAPTSRFTTTDAPPGAKRLNIEGRRTIGALQGFGQLWKKTYRVRLTGCEMPATDVMDIWKRYFPMFHPRDNHFYPSFAGVAPGEMLYFDTTLPALPGLPGVIPVASAVMILYADDESFTVMTPEGFPVAGWNTFSVSTDTDGTPVAQVQSLDRATDPIYEFGSRVMGGHRKQEETWQYVLASLARYVGVESPQVTVERECMDPKVQWKYAKNVWHNAGVRTFFYALGTPVRSLMARRRRHETDSPPAAQPLPTTPVPGDAGTRDTTYWARPTGALDASTMPADATTSTIHGRKVAGALQGFGQLWQKRYRIVLTDADVSPADVIAAWKEHFPLFWPTGPRFYAPLAGIAPGEVAAIDLFADTPVRLSTGVLVIYADDESFTYMTPEGHLFAGWITFSAFRDEAERTVAQAEVLIRASDPLFELGFRLGGSRQEDLFWEQTLRNVGAYFGVRADVITESTCLDPKIQWSRAGNIRHNAALRSMQHRAATQARRLVREVAHTGSRLRQRVQR